MVSHTSMTSDMSCSTRQMARPSAASRRSSSPKATVSCSVWPEAGSSSSSTRRLGHQRPGQLHHPGLAGRDLGDLAVGDVGQAGELEERSASGRRGVLRRRPAPQPLRISPRHPHVVADRQRGEQLQALERAGQPGPGPAVRGQPGDVAPVEHHLAGVGRCSPVTTLNSVVLPAPLGPMSPVTVPGSTASEMSVERGLAAEADRDAVGLKQGHRQLLAARDPVPAVRPAGRARRRASTRSAVGEGPLDADELRRELAAGPRPASLRWDQPPGGPAARRAPPRR